MLRDFFYRAAVCVSLIAQKVGCRWSWKGRVPTAVLQVSALTRCRSVGPSPSGSFGASALSDSSAFLS